jgi:hypothetical protein
MFQATAKEGVTIVGSTAPACNSHGLLTKNCKTDIPGNNVDACSAEATFVFNLNVPAPEIKFTSYVVTPAGQVNCYGCPTIAANKKEEGTAPEGCTN